MAERVAPLNFGFAASIVASGWPFQRPYLRDQELKIVEDVQGDGSGIQLKVGDCRMNLRSNRLPQAAHKHLSLPDEEESAAGDRVYLETSVMGKEIDEWTPAFPNMYWSDLQQKLQQAQELFPLSDVVFLHTLHLHVQDFRAATEGTRVWEELAQDLRQKLGELRRAAQAVVWHPEAATRILQGIQNLATSKLKGSGGPLVSDDSHEQPLVHEVGHCPQAPRLARDRYVTALTKACEMLEGLLSPRDGTGLTDYMQDSMLPVQITSGALPAKTLDVADEDIFFMTNRAMEGSNETLGDVFGTGLSDGLSMGTTNVRRSSNGKLGVHPDLQFSKSLEADEFKKALRAAVEKSESGAVMLYIHGCFTDFHRGVGYGAQIKRGVQHEGPMVVFTWPTGGRPTLADALRLRVADMYRSDEVKSSQSASALKDVLKTLATEVGAKSVHVIAYSMGARTLITAMDLLDPDALLTEQGATNRLYFVAPDVQVDVFSKAVCRFRFRPGAPPSTGSTSASEEVQGGSGGSDRLAEDSAASVSCSEARQGGTSRVSGGEGPAGTVRDGMAADVDANCVSISGTSSRDSCQVAKADVSSVGEVRPQDLGGSAEVRGELDGEEGALSGSGGGEDRSTADLLFQAFIDGDIGGAMRFARVVMKEEWERRISRFRTLFGRDDGALVGAGVGGGGRRDDAQMTLYAAENDLALVLAETLDRGRPVIRAGCKTAKFLLCHDSFETIDASALQSGLFTTGHFYLFHDIVRADLGHMIRGRLETPWWRQGQRWHIYDYWKLNTAGGPNAGQVAAAAAALLQFPALQGFGIDDSTLCPMFWASA